MRILLIGEYSNVHHTLSEGLKALGHEVVVASGGDGWKNYPRDIDLKRDPAKLQSKISFLCRLTRHFWKFKGYDVVQLINPMFLKLKAERMYPFYNYLRKHNRCVVMGAFGMDYFYVKACLDFHTFRYSDFNFGTQERRSHENDAFKRDWLYGEKGKLNRYIAADCDAIVAGLYEYYASYVKEDDLKGKLHFIPFPVELNKDTEQNVQRKVGAPVRFFIGVQRMRSAYKGTDVMLRALERVKSERPKECIVEKAESVPFTKYVKMLNDSEVILDQLYSYTPAMNSLEAMSRGMVNVGGGEPESYELLHESLLRPIINVRPDEEDVYQKLMFLVDHRDELIPRLRRESLDYVARYHDVQVVAKQYEQLYMGLLNR